MKFLDNQRAGFALPVAIVALVLVGVLVTGGFVAATQESRISQSTRFSGEAFNIAEFGLNEYVGSKKRAVYESGIPESRKLCRDGTTVDIDAECTTGPAVGNYFVTARKLGESDELFEVRSTGEVTRHGAGHNPVRTLAMLVRFASLDVEMDQAVTVAGPLSLAGNALVSGVDKDPEDWDCENDGIPLSETSHAIVAQDTMKVTYGNNEKNWEKDRAKHLEGTMAQDESITDDDSQFGRLFDETYDELAKQASKVLYGNVEQKTSPSLKDDKCNFGDDLNWGAPEDQSHKCADYFPVIHVQGNLELKANSTGQGILLVDGNVYVNGGFRFYGIIITKGTIGRNGTSRIEGMIFAQSGVELDDPSEITGNATIQFSSCAIRRAIHGSDYYAYAHAIGSRSWFDLSAVGVEY